jgi:hypothetical protein
MTYKLWKSVENVIGSGNPAPLAFPPPARVTPLALTEVDSRQSPVRACSACEGDYQDPDKTSWQRRDANDVGPGGEDVDADDPQRPRDASRRLRFAKHLLVPRPGVHPKPCREVTGNEDAGDGEDGKQ